MTVSKPVLRATGEGRMASGGTVSFTVVVDDVEVGVVADAREPKLNGGRKARTWIAAWREGLTGREPARWVADGFPTRTAAVEALLAAREEAQR